MDEVTVATRMNDSQDAPTINPGRAGTPVTRLWLAFVLGWLVALVVTGVLLVRERPANTRLGAALTVLTLLAVVYLWTTLRQAIGPADFSSEGPSPRVIRARLALLGVMIALVGALAWFAPNAEAWWLAMHVVVAAGLALPARLATAAIIAIVALTIGGAYAATGVFDAAFLILIAFAAGGVAIRQLTLAVAQLRAARAELARAAVDQERLRFARDLHDLLGHTLSVIILKSELAGRLLPRSPVQAAAEVADIEQAARDAQRQVRAAVVGYRQPVLRHELDAARQLLDAAGIGVTIECAEPALTPALDGLFAWTVREAVTNVIRHSGARRCDIQVSNDGTRARLMVVDDGRASVGATPNAGSGLAGLAERVAVHGGTIEAGPRADGGFAVAITAPAIGVGASP
jgi:two-component system, NarL family, sensor histidine kinase DesK